MEIIRDFLKKNNTCVIALRMLYDNNEVKLKTFYRVLSCVIYSIIDNYVSVDYRSCQSRNSSSISSNTISEQTGFNILPGTGIPELLLNLVCCHGFTEIPDSIIILNF